MKLVTSRLYNKEQTGERMYNLIDTYARDLANFKVNDTALFDLSISDFFNFVKNIPYRRDLSPTEVISRPHHILHHRKIGMDCKKKAILIASWAFLNNIPFHLIASSSRKNGKIHHVFPQVQLNGEWINADATYKKLKLGQGRPEITNFIVLPRKDEPELMGYVLEIIAAALQTGAKATGFFVGRKQKKRAKEIVQSQKILEVVTAINQKKHVREEKKRKEVFSISMLSLGLIAMKLLKPKRKK